MNKPILVSILVLSTIAIAKVSLPQNKISKEDYKALSRMDGDREVEVRLVYEGDTQKYQQELQESGVEIIAVEGDRIAIRTTLLKLNKIASSDWIAWIEMEKKEKKTRSGSKSATPSVISAQILCDNPPTDYQTQIQGIGIRITKVEGNVATIETDTYDQLHKIANLSYVMRIANIMEIPVLPKEKE